jgi:hypothetical protein
LPGDGVHDPDNDRSGDDTVHVGQSRTPTKPVNRTSRHSQQRARRFCFPHSASSSLAAGRKKRSCTRHAPLIRIASRIVPARANHCTNDHCELWFAGSGLAANALSSLASCTWR